MAISITPTPAPTNPQRSDPLNFRHDADQYVNWHTQDFVPELTQIITDLNATIQNLWVGTSSTSTTIGTGSKSFTMVQANLAFGIGNHVRIANTSNPTSYYMSGIITAYNKTTKVLTVNVLTKTGTATLSAWTIALEPPDEYNRVKTWSTMTGAASVPLIVNHLGQYWRLDSNLSDVTTKVPGTASEWTKIGILSSYTVITSSNPAWAKNSNATWVLVEVINGGNSGQAGVSTGTSANVRGGAGGISARKLFRAADLSSTVAIVVGAGGAAAVATSAVNLLVSGNIGGQSSFGTFSTFSSSNYLYAALTIPEVTRYLHGNFNGGDGSQDALQPGGRCIIGGGGGGSGYRSSTESRSSAGGDSVEHGNGGAGNYGLDIDRTATSGAIPGGGGGGCAVGEITTTRTATSGAGGRGEVRIWQW